MLGGQATIRTTLVQHCGNLPDRAGPLWTAERPGKCRSPVLKHGNLGRAVSESLRAATARTIPATR